MRQCGFAHKIYYLKNPFHEQMILGSLTVACCNIATVHMTKGHHSK